MIKENTKNVSAYEEAKAIRKNIIKKLYPEDSANLEELYDDEEGRLYQIAAEYHKIYDIIDDYFQNKIESEIIRERKKGISSNEYLPEIEKKEFKLERKIAMFFTLEKYAKRRMFVLDVPYLDFIKKNALNSECYELFQILNKNGK